MLLWKEIMGFSFFPFLKDDLSSFISQYLLRPYDVPTMLEGTGEAIMPERGLVLAFVALESSRERLTANKLAQ